MDESTQEPMEIPSPGPEEITVTDGTPASYETAVERLEEIIDRLDSGQAGLRETLDLCREGRGLVDYCATELDAVGEGLKELNLDDLAATLAPPASPGAWPGLRGAGRRGASEAGVLRAVAPVRVAAVG